MNYHNVIPAKFIKRPNRFIAIVEIDNQEVTVHVKNTGRCKELLIYGATVYLEKAVNPNRKTQYDLIAVEKERENDIPLLINMDSQVPNDVVEEWLNQGVLFSENASIKCEVTYGKSRFDFFVEDGERKAFIEVKGVTLEDNGVAMFPEAPTERGVKHINELIECLHHGYEAYTVFVIQMKSIIEFRPNDTMHKAFGDELRLAHQQGVNIIAMDSIVTPESITIDKPIPINLGEV